MPDWKKIKAEYIRGGTSYRKLASKYGVSFSTLQRIARKEKWTDLRRQSDDKVTTKIIDSAASQEAKRVDMFDDISEILLQRIKRDLVFDNLSLTRYRDITGALKDLKEIKGIKSDADMREQEARIEKLRREAQTETENKDIHVVFDGEWDAFSK